jgi:hypothetical protein
MKKSLLFLIILFTSINAFAQIHYNVQWWQAQGFLLSNSSGLSIVNFTHDEDDNTYVLGKFQGVGLVFTNSPNPQYNFTNPEKSSYCYYLSKYNSSGNLLWVKYLNTDYNFWNGNNIMIDTDVDKNLIINFLGKTKNPNDSMSIGKYTIVKLDTSGNHLWSAGTVHEFDAWNPSGLEYNNVTMHTDSKGDVYSLLFVEGYNPNSPIIFGKDTIPTQKASVVLVKYDKNGKYKWVKNIISYNSIWFGNSNNDGNYSAIIDIDGNDNIYIIGTFEDSAVVGGNKIYSNGLTDIYLLKLNTNGNIVDKKIIGGNNREMSFNLALDLDNNVYLQFGTRGSSYIKFGNDTVIDNLTNTNIVFKLNSNLKTVWLKSSNSHNHSLSVDKKNNVFIGGMIEKYSRLYFASDTILGITEKNIFYAMYDNNGIEKWAQTVTGSPVFFTTSSRNGVPYILLKTSSPLVINNRQYHQGFPYGLIYVVRYPEYIKTGIRIESPTVIKISPNPSNGIIEIKGLTSNDNKIINIYDVQGKLILSKDIKEQSTIDISELNNGIYIIKIGEMTQRIIKI